MPPMLVEMGNGLQHVALYGKHSKAQACSDLLVGISLDAAEQEDLQHSRFELAQDLLVMNKLLARFELLVLIELDRAVQSFDQGDRNLRKAGRSVLGPVDKEIAGDPAQIGLRRCHLRRRGRAQEPRNGFLREIVRLVWAGEPCLPAEEADQPRALGAKQVGQLPFPLPLRRVAGVGMGTAGFDAIGCFVQNGGRA